MTHSQLQEILKSNLLVLSEADGEHLSMTEEHMDAGAHVLIAPPVKDMDSEEADTILDLLDIVADQGFVAGQISLSVVKDFEYEALYEWVLSRTMWLDNQGVSMVFLTDCADVVSARCAIRAIREAVFDMPICVGVSVLDAEENLQEAISMLIALQPLGVTAFGISHMDVEDTLSVLSELQAFTTVPLFSLADSGKFLTPEVYGDYVPSLVHNKCAAVGLSGASPALTAAATKEIWQLAPFRPDFPMLNAVCSKKQALFLDFGGKVVSAGKQMLKIKTEKMDEIKQILPVINQDDAAPVCFHIKDIDVLEYAISRYNGRPAVCSDEYGEITAKELGALIMSEEKVEIKGEAK